MTDFGLLHPREQIVTIMNRIYTGGMTTTSGGNLSIRDPDGSLWISPAGVDKGSLRPADIVHVLADGRMEGLHPPSSEYPFHKAIYDVRSDVGAVLHAHPSALVAFSIVRQTPDTHILPQAEDVCGKVGYAAYALPGSRDLGANIAARFKEGFDCVLLENHGVVCAGAELLDAYHRFETLDFCARLHVQARRLGAVKTLREEQLLLAHLNRNTLPEGLDTVRTTREKELRRLMSDVIHRACDGRIMTSTEGTLSARLDDGAFLITPYGQDRRYLEPGDLVTIRDGRREADKVPSRAVVLHGTIYEQHPQIASIVTAQPPAAMAFGVTDQPLNVRTIPESYVLLQDIPKVPFGIQYTDENALSTLFSRNCPVILLENDALMATGSSVIQAFDRLEVAEFTARSILNALALGGLVAMDEQQIADLRAAFLK
jgi:L-fuculose-phosphate aldolase